MNVSKENHRNLPARSIKPMVPSSTAVAVVKRPVLGELSNKLNNQTCKVKLSSTKLESKQIVQKTTYKIQKSEFEVATGYAKIFKPKLPSTKTELKQPVQKNTCKIQKAESKTTVDLVTKVTTATVTTETVQKHLVQTTEVNRNHNKYEEVSYSTRQLSGIADPDVNDTGNPLLVSEYICDIFNHLKHLESKYKIQEGYLTSHQSTPNMRRILLNWMVDVAGNFKFFQETLHLSVGLLDRYLQASKEIGRDTLQLVGVTALFLASKYEEIVIPSLSDFLYICDHSFTQSQMLSLECDMLKKIGFFVGRPLSLHFLRRYSKIAKARSQEHNLAKYLLEIFLLEYELCHINPSVQAAAACCLSICILNDVIDPVKVWTKTLIHYTTYQYSDIKQVVLNLTYFLVKMEKTKHQAIKIKYANSALDKISCHPKLKGIVVQKFLKEAQSLRT